MTALTAAWPYLVFSSAAIPASLLLVGVAGCGQERRDARARRRGGAVKNNAPHFRSLDQLSGERSPIPAILDAADEIAGQAAEVERLRAENATLADDLVSARGAQQITLAENARLHRTLKSADLALECVRDERDEAVTRRAELAAELAGARAQVVAMLTRMEMAR